MVVAGKDISSRSTIWLAVIWLAAVVSMAAPGLLWWLPQTLLYAPLTLLSGIILFTLPGLAILRWLYQAPLIWFERLIYAASLSCGVLPLLLLVSDLIGWRWNSVSAWLMMLMLSILAFWPQPKRTSRQNHHRNLIGLAIALLTITALAIRFFIVREVPVGFFGDSYHHTVITQLLIDHGGLFHSWQPYAPAVTFTYHYAFHTMAAWWHWLSGLSAAQGVVLVGQVMNGLATPLTFLLTARLTNSRLTGLWAALMVGFLSLYPAYYVNWGRYTQLAGQTVLPAVALAWMTLLDQTLQPHLSWRTLLKPLFLTSIASAGLLLSHYRVAILTMCFILAYAMTAFALYTSHQWQYLLRMSVVGLLGAAGTGLLVGPWLWRVQQGQIMRLASILLNTSSETSNPISLDIIGAAFRTGLFLPTVLGLASLLWRRQAAGIVLTLWAIFAWLAANPQLIGLNGQGLITTFTVLIGAYVAITPAAGAGWLTLIRLFAILTRSVWKWQDRSIIVVQIILALIVLGWGTSIQVSILDPSYQLATPADIAAAEWIKTNLPADAAIFVNGFPAYGGYVYAGNDGGWWLSFLTGRRTNLLPMAVGFEATDPPDTLRQIAALHQSIQQFPIGSAEAAAALRASGFRFLYDGPAANPGGEYLDPAQIDTSPFYELIYRQNGVSIWRIR